MLYDKPHTNPACANPLGKNVTRACLYGARYARSVLPRPRANIIQYSPRARLITPENTTQWTRPALEPRLLTHWPLCNWDGHFVDIWTPNVVKVNWRWKRSSYTLTLAKTNFPLCAKSFAAASKSGFSLAQSLHLTGGEWVLVCNLIFIGVSFGKTNPMMNQCLCLVMTYRQRVKSCKRQIKQGEKKTLSTRQLTNWIHLSTCLAALF